MSLGSVLIGLEQKMLEAVERDYEDWMNRPGGGPCPASLFHKMQALHTAVTKRLKVELRTEETDPEKLLLAIELQRAHLMRVVREKRAMEAARVGKS